jgi:hypothetical protein
MPSSAKLASFTFCIRISSCYGTLTGKNVDRVFSKKIWESIQALNYHCAFSREFYSLYNLKREPDGDEEFTSPGKVSVKLRVGFLD